MMAAAVKAAVRVYLWWVAVLEKYVSCGAIAIF